MYKDGSIHKIENWLWDVDMRVGASDKEEMIINQMNKNKKKVLAQTNDGKVL